MKLPWDLVDLLIIWALYSLRFLSKASITWSYKPFNQWLQLLNSPPIDWCEFKKSNNRLPFISDFYGFIKKEFPELPTDCPIRPGRYYVYNKTINHGEGIMDNTSHDLPLASGAYRFNITFSTKEDPFVGNVMWVTEFKEKFGWLEMKWRKKMRNKY